MYMDFNVIRNDGISEMCIFIHKVRGNAQTVCACVCVTEMR